jgi:hypothetical protein
MSQSQRSVRDQGSVNVPPRLSSPPGKFNVPVPPVPPLVGEDIFNDIEEADLARLDVDRDGLAK